MSIPLPSHDRYDTENDLWTTTPTFKRIFGVTACVPVLSCAVLYGVWLRCLVQEYHSTFIEKGSEGMRSSYQGNRGGEPYPPRDSGYGGDYARGSGGGQQGVLMEK